MNNIKTLYYDRIDISKGTDVNKTSELKELKPTISIFQMKGENINYISAICVMIY